jgi:hypothetical protein
VIPNNPGGHQNAGTTSIQLVGVITQPIPLPETNAQSENSNRNGHSIPLSDKQKNNLKDLLKGANTQAMMVTGAGDNIQAAVAPAVVPADTSYVTL